MSYKEQLIEIIQKINDETLAERLLMFAKRFIKNWGD